MKKYILVFLLFTIYLNSYSQNISYKDLIFIMNSSETERIDELLTKRGYLLGEVSNSNDCDSFEWNFKNLNQKPNNIHIVKKFCDEHNNKVVAYSTTNPNFYQSIKTEVLNEKYKKIGENTYGNMLNVAYKKGDYNFQFSKKNVEKINNETFILNQYVILLRVHMNE